MARTSRVFDRLIAALSIAYARCWLDTWLRGEMGAERGVRKQLSVLVSKRATLEFDGQLALAVTQREWLNSDLHFVLDVCSPLLCHSYVVLVGRLMLSFHSRQVTRANVLTCISLATGPQLPM